MGRIGMENVPANIDERYHKEEKEFLVICYNVPEYVSRELCNNYYNMTIGILGYIATESGCTSEEKSYMTWAGDLSSERYFTKTGVYRIKGRLSDEKHPENIYNTGSIYLTEIISGNEKNDFLENLLTEYKKEVSINSEIFGKMVLNKANECYNASVHWHDKIISFKMYVSKNENAVDTLSLMEDFYRNLDYWDKKSREKIAKAIPDIDESTRKEFSENLVIADIYFWADGTFTVTYEDYSEIVGNNISTAGNIMTDI